MELKRLLTRYSERVDGLPVEIHSHQRQRGCCCMHRHELIRFPPKLRLRRAFRTTTVCLRLNAAPTTHHEGSAVLLKSLVALVEAGVRGVRTKAAACGVRALLVIVP